MGEFADSNLIIADWEKEIIERISRESVMGKAARDVTVTWLDSKTEVSNCTISTDFFNGKNWIVIQRPHDHDYVVDIAAIRNMYLYTDEQKCLGLNLQHSRLKLEFADVRQSSSWLKTIKDLKESGHAPDIQGTCKVSSPPKVSTQCNDGMEIPYDLRLDVKLAIAETGFLGPIGAFSSGADVASVAGWWGYLLVQYSKYYGIHLDKETAKKICSTALLGMGGYYLGCKTATKLFHLIPGAGTITAMGISSLQNIIFTYRFAITTVFLF